MKLRHVTASNYSRLADYSIEVRDHLVVVGANDVGKTSILRLLNFLLGASTAQLYQGLSIEDLRDRAVTLVATATFHGFSDEERALFFREIDIDPIDKVEKLVVRLEVSTDPDDEESVTISRWCPGRGEIRPLSREQIVNIGWRYLPASRAASSSQLDGPNGAVQVLLKAVESELGAEKSTLGDILGAFNEKLEVNTALIKLRTDMANHLSNSMPHEMNPENLSIRTSAAPTDSVLENVSMYIARDGAFIPLADQSDGLRQLVSMTLFDLAEGAANVIAIDEPELHLHPLSQRTVANLLTQRVNQKIIVTHSPYIVERFDPIQVVAVSPDGSCHQINPSRFTIEEKTQAHWWSPRMLEALTARFAILVEGVADRLIVEAVARTQGISLDRLGAVVFELGGADNFPTVYKLLGPDGFGVRVLGLVDEAESARWVGSVGGKPKNVIGQSVFISKVDLEDEYCRALGAPAVVKALVDSGVAQEAGLLSSSGASRVEEIGTSQLAKFCRSSSKSINRKVPSALAIAKSLTGETALRIQSVTDLLNRLLELSSK